MQVIAGGAGSRPGRAAAVGRGSWRLRASLLLALAIVLGHASRTAAEPSRELHWSPDGQYLAASMWWPLGEGVWLFRRDGSRIRRVSAKADWVQWVAGDRLLTGPIGLSDNESWSLIDLQGKRLQTISPDAARRNPGEITAGTWKTSPDGRYLVYTSVSGSDSSPRYAVVLYRFSDRRSVRFPVDFWGCDDKVVWSPDSRYVYSAEMDGNRLWRLDVAAERLERKTRPSGRFVGDMAANTANQLIIVEGTVIKDAKAGTVTDDGDVTLFDWATGRQRPISRRNIHSIAFGRDPNLFVGFEENTAMGGGMVCVGTLQKGGDWLVTRLGRSTSTTIFAISPDSKRLAYAPDEGGVKVMDLAPYRQAAASRPSRPRGAPGTAVFVRLAGDGDSARSDVYEQGVTGGRPRMLISHSKLPKSFRGRIERALPSPDGTLMLLTESEGAVFRNTRTGARNMQFGSVCAGQDETQVEEFGGGHWLWSRHTSTVKRVTLLGRSQSLLNLRRTSLDWPMEWSPRRSLLLLRVHSEINRPTERLLSESLRVFDGATGKMRTIRTVPADGMLFAGWSGDGAAVLVGERVGEKSSRLALVSLTGQAQRLVTVSREVLAAAISPDGRQLATADSSGSLSLFRRNSGRQGFSRVARIRMGLPEDPDDLEGEMAFSPDGRTLAVRVACSYGVHHTGFWERLWTVQTTAAKAALVAPTIAYNEDKLHVVLGWVPGQAALFLLSRGAAGQEGEYCRLWLQPVKPMQPARLLSDTGRGGIGLAWWGK